MKKRRVLVLVAMVGLSTFVPVLVGSGHGSGMQGKGMKGMQKSMPAPMMGAKIRTTQVNGYILNYNLINMKERMKAMKNMPMKGMDMSTMKSHHLMVYVTSPNGQKISDAKVGYKITGPDRSEQKVMCMAMSGGYGADIDLKARGTYTIKTKIVAGDKKLLDEFRYMVE